MNIPNNVIAHALGGLEGYSYLNCLECFEYGYKRGFRFFEMDFLETSDGKLVGMHNGFEEKNGQLLKPLSLIF